jgi:hypothetical protein
VESGTENMERRILILYRRACRQGMPEVAEHLLCALETLDHDARNQELGQRRSALADAYLELAARQ